MISGFKQIINNQSDIEILWTANSRKDAGDFISQGLIPEVALLDIAYPDGDGFSLAEKLKESDLFWIKRNQLRKSSFLTKYS